MNEDEKIYSCRIEPDMEDDPAIMDFIDQYCDTIETFSIEYEGTVFVIRVPKEKISLHDFQHKEMLKNLIYMLNYNQFANLILLDKKGIQSKEKNGYIISVIDAQELYSKMLRFKISIDTLNEYEIELGNLNLSKKEALNLFELLNAFPRQCLENPVFFSRYFWNFFTFDPQQDNQITIFLRKIKEDRELSLPQNHRIYPSHSNNDSFLQLHYELNNEINEANVLLYIKCECGQNILYKLNLKTILKSFRSRQNIIINCSNKRCWRSYMIPATLDTLFFINKAQQKTESEYTIIDLPFAYRPDVENTYQEYSEQDLINMSSTEYITLIDFAYKYRISNLDTMRQVNRKIKTLEQKGIVEFTHKKGAKAWRLKEPSH